MSSKSDYLENKVLDHIFGGGDFTRPASIWIALYTAAPDDTGGGTEVTGGSYARSTHTNNATNWPAASGGSKSNGIEMAFVEATASWGLVTHFALHGASTGDTEMLYWGALTTSKTVDSGDTFKFPIGNITITED